MGEPSSVLMAAKLPAAAMTTAAVGGASLGQVHGQHAQSAADGDQRRLGSEDHAEAQGGERGQDHPGELDRRSVSRRS